MILQETTATFYKDIDSKDVRIVLIEGGEDEIMSEVDSELGTFALKLTQCYAVRNYYPLIRSISQ